MTKVKDSILDQSVLKRVKYSYGDFYFFEHFIISEIKEGAVYDWNKASDLIEVAENFYDDLSNIHYISNRVERYSLVPQDWVKFFASNRSYKSYSVVTYNSGGEMNLQFEKLFYEKSIQKFKSLEEAVNAIYKEENVPLVELN